MRNAFWRLSCCIAVVFLAQTAEAQQAGKAAHSKQPGRIATKVALRTELYQGQEIVILRRPVFDGGDIIVLSGQDITANKFAAAALALTAEREDGGDVATTPTKFTLSEVPDAPKTEVQVSARLLAKKKAAPHVVDPLLGDVQFVTMYLPSKSGRASLKARGRADFSVKGKPQK